MDTYVESQFLSMQPVDPNPVGYVPTQSVVPMGVPMQQPVPAPVQQPMPAPVQQPMPVPVQQPMPVPMQQPMPAPVASQFVPTVAPAMSSFSDHLNVLNQC